MKSFRHTLSKTTVAVFAGNGLTESVLQSIQSLARKYDTVTTIVSKQPQNIQTKITANFAEAESLLHFAAQLDETENLVVVAPTESVSGLKRLLESYNRVDGLYNFKSIEVIPENFKLTGKPVIRENYVNGIGFKLGDIVEDRISGVQGKIVYRGPTYVTLQIDENVSFKRWVEDVDPMTHLPDDIKQHHLNRIKFCPGAVKEFSKLLDDSSLDQSIVIDAIDKTAHYLDIEEHANPDIPETLNDHAVAEFVRNFRAAAQLLEALGVAKEHEPYMLKHIHAMMNLVHGDDPGPKEESMNNFKNFYIEEAKNTGILSPNEEHLSDKDLEDIEKHIDKLEWEDIKHLYDDQEHEELEESLEEGLTAAQRMKKKMEFLKTKAKREIAAELARKRISSQGKLKKKAIVHARALIMKKLLKGRDKSSLSAAEKSRIEAIVHNAKNAVVRISNKLLPKLRELEQKRMKKVHEEWSEKGDTEKASYDQTVSNTVPDDLHLGVDHAKLHLAGQQHKNPDPRKEIDPQKHVRKLKQFRKMEV